MTTGRAQVQAGITGKSVQVLTLGKVRCWQVLLRLSASDDYPGYFDGQRIALRIVAGAAPMIEAT